ncbi:hypothetical protein Q8F55_008509 [Vanrija albida]|uniref:AB hydrolase-1 domain-containing protein n=1 Tax=Vanrija albida TaxID=181172 RepID=A0ABR3PS29_9TREE
MPTPSASPARLPPDLHLTIADELDWDNLWSLRLTCKHLNAASLERLRSVYFSTVSLLCTLPGLAAARRVIADPALAPYVHLELGTNSAGALRRPWSYLIRYDCSDAEWPSESEWGSADEAEDADGDGAGEDEQRKYKDIRVPVHPTVFQTIGGVSSYPRPSEVDLDQLLEIRPLLGLLPPPDEPAPREPTRLPLRPPPTGWVSSYHAAPAAYPRLMREQHGTLTRESFTPPADESAEARALRIEQEAIASVRDRYDAKLWDLEEAAAVAPPKQWLSVERWRRIKPVGGYTLVCAHAGGLQKEHWHEVVRGAIEGAGPSRAAFGGGSLTRPANAQIDEVWLLDDLVHNESNTLNAGRMAHLQSWEDTGRDVLNLIQHVIAGVPVGADAPWDLPWVAAAEPRRHLVGVGHSFGGCAVVHAAHERPDLFDGLFLVDPVPIPHFLAREAGYEDPLTMHPLTALIMSRRYLWPSLAEARGIMRKSAFFARFSDAQLEVYLRRGLVPVDPARPDGPVTLATPVWAEAATFTEIDAGARGYDKLPHLAVPVGWVMAGNSGTTRGDEMTQHMVWRPPRARNERHLKSGHLLTQEDPHLVAQSLARYLTTLASGEWDTPAATARL